MEKDTDNRNKIYFRIISWFLVFLFIALIEIFLRLFSYGTDMHLFVKPLSDSKENYMKVNPNVGEKYFTRFEATSGTNDMFLKQKPENGFRIFLLGSSTLYGYPYGTNLMASRILHRRLDDAYPEKSIEVVNTSISAINSITLKDYHDQVLKYEPDAILIYAGHNEYYGAFGVGSNETMSKNPGIMSMHFKLMNLRIYQLMRSAIGGLSKQIERGPGNSEERGTLMKRIVQDEDIVYQGEKYEHGIKQYETNLSYILEKSEKQDVPVFISDLISNVRDLPPFGDVESSGFSALKTYQEALDELALGDTLKARNLFYRAKDLDPVRFRAPERINEIIYDLVEEYGVTLIPAKDWFSNASVGGLIGDNLLTEHVHPNIEGQFTLADAFYSSIVSSGLIDMRPDPNTTRSSAFYRQNWSYTTLDSLIGIYRIEQLKSDWPFSPIGNEITFRDTFQVSGLMDSLAFSILTNPDANIRTIHLQLAEYLGDRGSLELSLNEYKSLISMNPYFSEYYNRAANCLLRLNDLHAAEAYLRKSVLYGENYFAFSLLGELEVIKSNYRGALQLFNDALKLAERDKSGDAELKVLISDIRKKISEVKSLSSQAMHSRNFHYSKYIPYNIEQTYKRALSFSGSDLDSVKHYLLQCLEINDCPLVNFRIGDVLYQQQDLTALQFYNKAYSGFARDPDFLVRYCVTNIFNQDKVKANEIFQELSAISPQHSELVNLRQALVR